MTSVAEAMANVFAKETHTTVDTALETAPELSVEGKVLAIEEANGGIIVKKLPREVRTLIYEYLLVSPGLAYPVGAAELETQGATEEDDDGTVYIKYGLSPAILLTCRFIYAEASLVLYGRRNTFLFGMFRKSRAESPLFRIRGGDCFAPLEDGFDENSFQAHPAMKKVHNWKVLITNSMSHAPSSPYGMFVLFCDTAGTAVGPKTVQVCIVTPGRETGDLYHGSHLLPFQCHHHTMERVLAPLQYFQNLTKLEIGGATDEDQPEHGPPDEEMVLREITEDFQTALRNVRHEIPCGDTTTSTATQRLPAEVVFRPYQAFRPIDRNARFYESLRGYFMGDPVLPRPPKNAPGPSQQDNGGDGGASQGVV